MSATPSPIKLSNFKLLEPGECGQEKLCSKLAEITHERNVLARALEILPNSTPFSCNQECDKCNWVAKYRQPDGIRDVCKESQRKHAIAIAEAEIEESEGE